MENIHSIVTDNMDDFNSIKYNVTNCIICSITVFSVLGTTTNTTPSAAQDLFCPTCLGNLKSLINREQLIKHL